MIRWERQMEANQADMAIVKRYATKRYREWPQYSKASKETTIFNKSANKSYKKPQLRNDKDTAAIMFAQMEMRHKEQMESLPKTMQQVNERSMKFAENQMREMKEAIISITQ